MNQVAPDSSALSRFARAWWWSLGVGALAIALLSLATSSASREAGAVEGSCPPQLTIDFDGLPAGTIIGEQYAEFGVHISAVANEGFPDALIVFDTNAPPTHDPDLAVGIGNIAVLAENVTDVKPPPSGDGLVDDPDENNFGGRAIFEFDQDVSIGSFLFVDKDHASPNFAVAYNAAGEVLVSVPVPQGADGSVQRIDVNADGVRRLELVYRESGGFTGIEVACEQATPTPTPVTAAPGSPAPSPPAPAAVQTPAAPPSAEVLAVRNLPAGGGDPSDRNGAFNWPAATLLGLGLTLVVVSSFFSMRGVRR